MQTPKNTLRQRDFIIVLLGQIISLFGNAILRFALPLHLLRATGSAALFGGLGGVLGMHIFHHKTRHLRFRLGFPALLLVQVVLVGLWAWQQLGR